MNKMIRGLALLCMVSSVPAMADTLVLKDGLRIDAVVLHKDENIIKVEIGGRQRTYAVTDVVTIEENERTGHFDLKLAEKLAEERIAELNRLTGLTPSQRAKVKELMGQLQSTDEDVSAKARRDLVLMHSEVDLTRYFEWWLPGLSHRLAAPAMDVLSEIGPRKAVEIAYEYAENLYPASRAMALKVLGKAGGPDAIKLIARGLVDPEIDVRIAAAEALGHMKVKEATPALIEAVDSANPHLTNAARFALQRIWSTDNELVNFETSAEWEEYWHPRSSAISASFTQIALAPLVQADLRYEDE